MHRRLFVCLLVLFLLLPFSALAAVSSFDTPSTIITGAGPNSMATGDFNGDAALDLAVANSSTKISILLGNGTGGFNAGTSVVVSAPPAGIAAVDFNGDNLLDLAVTDASTSNISILQGNGDGTFQAALNPAPVAGPAPKGVAAGDLNNDGKPELIVTNSGDSTISVFNNTTISDPDLAVTTAPASITVPASDADGAYTVTWAAVTGTGVTYTLQEATNAAFTTGLRTVVTGTATASAAITGRTNALTYYYRVNAISTGNTVSAWTASANGCAVSITCAAPPSITVPVSDADGAYDVSWAASATAGVTYTVQEATNNTFTVGLRQVYSGTALNVAITGRVLNSTYYYRVRASKTGLTASAWTNGANGCLISSSATCAPPASITVPASDTDGIYSVSWGASTTAGVTYTLQEATNATFTTGLRTAFTGAGLTASITGRTLGTVYYYRVRAAKTGLTASAWRTGAAGCVVGSVACAAPPSITVPVSDADGAYTVSWTASTTPGVTYTVQEATNNTFTVGLRQVYSGTATTPVAITGRILNSTYYYRVRASKVGLTASAWTNGANGCQISTGTICAAPSTITVPASDTDGIYSISWTASTTAGVTYVLQESTDPTFPATTATRTAFTGSGLTASITGRTLGTVYYYQVRAQKTGFTPSAWTAGAAGCVVGSVACAAPPSISVPVSDADGAYEVSWTASTTPGVTYTVQEATNNTFTVGLRQVYSGTATTPVAITGRILNSTYYYRVRASKVGLTASAWTNGANGCQISTGAICAAPSTITVPASDTDGIYSISWTASTTAGVTYVLQESTDPTFPATTATRTAFTGGGLTASITGRTLGTVYYYQVRAQKTGFTPSSWTTGAAGCVVGSVACAAPPSISVPASDPDGAYEVSWTASTTPGVTYTVQEATNNTFTTGLRSVYSGTATTPVAITGRALGTTYYYRVRATKTGLTASAWTTDVNGCLVGAACAAPASITVPASDDDGAYSVSWAASTTAGVTYTVQEATNITFTAGLRQVYSGTATTPVAITGRVSGTTYYYRVQATKTGLTASTWTTGANGCAVALAAAAPASITVPVSGATTGYAVSWGASTTVGVTYILQEATNAGFTTGLRTAYSGAALTANITTRTAGTTYYYRVYATKSGFTTSPYTIGANGCLVSSPVCEIPTDLTVPAGSATDAYTVSWTASVTPGVNYILQEATNATFTTGLRQAYSGAATSAAISGRLSGNTYYYRVQATKSLYTSSPYATAANGCVVSITCGAPGSLTVPATSDDGSATLSWTASSTASVTYILEKATNAAFDENVSTVYSGTFLTATANGLSGGTDYYFRVKATRSGYISSAPTAGSNYCRINLPVTAPTSISVPAISNTGDYAVSWAVSPTPGVTYVLEEATNASFTAGNRIVYTGVLLTTSITGNLTGTYYYRVQATKPGFISSAYTTAGNSCAVTLNADGPPSIFVQSTSPVGVAYTVSWEASTTTGVTYVLEEATDAAFTTPVTAYSGPLLTVDITKGAAGTFYYRVQATKPGYVSSAFTTGTECVVGP